MRLHEMREARAAQIAAMRKLTEEPKGEGGDLSAEQVTEFDKRKGELEGLEKRIERQVLLDEADRRVAGEPIEGTGDDRLDEALKDFSLRRAIVSQIPDMAATVDCSRERELATELAKRSAVKPQGIMVPMTVFRRPLEKRVLTAVTGGAAGADLVGTDHLGGQFIDLLRARLVTQRLGARVLSGLVGNVDIPRLDASGTSGWIAENAALTPADPDLGKVSLAPKHVGTVCEFSRNLLLQSSPDIEQLLRSDFAQLLAGAVDRAAIKGGGANEPDGILETAGIDTSVSIKGTPTWAKILQIIEAVETENAEGTSWATTPSVVRLLRSTVKVTTTDSVMIQQEPGSLAGYPLIASTNVPSNLPDADSPAELDAHALIFGAWSDVIIGYWSAFDVLVNPFETTAYLKGNVLIRGLLTADVALRHPESFAASVDVDPAND